MPRIIPIRDLRNTAEISKMCKETQEPIYITKNGYGDMVIMDVKLYEKLLMEDVFAKLTESEASFAAGRSRDAFEALDELRTRMQKKYDV